MVYLFIILSTLTLIFFKNTKLLFSKSIRYLIAFFTLLLTTVTFSQEEKLEFDQVKEIENYGRFRYVEVKGHTGAHMYTGQSLGEAVETGYGSFEVRFGWQQTDPDHWSKSYGFSSYGIGWYTGFLGDPDIFGTPNALFGFINFPIGKPGKRNTFQISPAIGVTYNLIPFNEESNPTNDAIGFKMSVYLNMNFGFEYIINRDLDLLYGVDYTHFSNGRLYTPNHGLDMFGLNLGLRYMYNADQRKFDKDIYTEDLLQSRFKRYPGIPNTKINYSFINVYGAAGTVQNSEDAGTSKRYVTFSGVADYQYVFSNMHAATVGLDLFYDESLKTEYPANSDRILLAAHAGYDFMFADFTFRAQVGTYLTDNRGKGNVFVRAALQYAITDWMYAQAGLKTRNGARADWIEWGIGFKPFKW